MTDCCIRRSHKEWRRIAKKVRRKRIRQCLAQHRKEEQKKRQSSPTYLTELAKKRLLEEYEIEANEKERMERNEKWIRDEEEAQRKWREQKQLEQLAQEEKAKELERIRTEWEKEQQKIRQKKEEIEKKKAEEERRKQETLKRINEFMLQGGEVPQELCTICESNPGKEICSFFSKVGACKFGPQCSRNHQIPGISKVLLFSNFYCHFTLDQNHSTEYDTDIALEYEDSDMYLHFKEFYNDVVPELKKFGKIKMVRVCCNTEFHLRGNVYVEYSTFQEALVAYNKFQGRWYGAKQLHVDFVTITDWGGAICGDFARKRCPKGKSCNFLHVFRNPRNEFPIEWNRSKAGTNHSLSESFCDGSDSPPIRGRSFRWSESPCRLTEKSRNNHDERNHRSRHRKRIREENDVKEYNRSKRRKSSHDERSSKKQKTKEKIKS